MRFLPQLLGNGWGLGLGWKWAPIGGLQYQTHMQAPKYDVQFLRSEALRSSSSSSSSSSRTRQIKECKIEKWNMWMHLSLTTCRCRRGLHGRFRRLHESTAGERRDARHEGQSGKWRDHVWSLGRCVSSYMFHKLYAIIVVGIIHFSLSSF